MTKTRVPAAARELYSQAELERRAHLHREASRLHSKARAELLEAFEAYTDPAAAFRELERRERRRTRAKRIILAGTALAVGLVVLALNAAGQQVLEALLARGAQAVAIGVGLFAVVVLWAFDRVG